MSLSQIISHAACSGEAPFTGAVVPGTAAGLAQQLSFVGVKVDDIVSAIDCLAAITILPVLHTLIERGQCAYTMWCSCPNRLCAYPTQGHSHRR